MTQLDSFGFVFFLLLFLFYKGQQNVTGQFVKWNYEISFLPKMTTHTDTLTPKSTPHRITDQALLRRKQDGFCHEKAMEQRETRSWNPPCWKHWRRTTRQRCGWRGGMGKDVAEAWQWLLMRDYKAISNTMKASGGPSVTTNGNK